MNLSDYEVIADVLGELNQEYGDLQKQIDEYQDKIKEIDCYIRSVVFTGDQDYKIFSPRSPEDLYQDEIKKSDNEKKILQSQLNQCYHKQNLLRSKIEKLKQLKVNDRECHIKTDGREKNLALLNIQEEDRQRIARDLHDTSLQTLTHVIHKIELCSMYIDQDPVRAKLELSVVNKNLRDIIEEIRSTIFNLRPMTFDDLGLKSAFEQFIQIISENRDCKINMDFEEVICNDDMILSTIYRIVQECFINIDKHAEATKVNFTCKSKNNICIIEIEDNGKGFSTEEVKNKQDKHFGLVVIQERVDLLGGKINIDSEKGRGTRIHIEIPL